MTWEAPKPQPLPVVIELMMRNPRLWVYEMQDRFRAAYQAARERAERRIIIPG